MSDEERAVMKHFREHHRRDDLGRFIVPLPRKPDVAPLGESRSVAVKRFITVERSLKANGKAREFADSVMEYFNLDHAEPVPASDLEKPWENVYYMPMHAVRKASSTTSQLHVVFDASAKTKSGTSFNVLPIKIVGNVTIHTIRGCTSRPTSRFQRQNRQQQMMQLHLKRHKPPVVTVK